MAAHVSSSSSEDEDEKQRLQEAVYDLTTCTETASSSRMDAKRKRGPLKHRLREVQDRDEEANSTGISWEVRDFVAKKLSCFLDSCITDQDSSQSNSDVTRANEERDCGFRLFSSSDPATEVNLSGVTPQVRRRRQVGSSSSGESDSEDEKARLAEAAVTHQAILLSSAPLQVVDTPPSSSDATSTQEKVASSSTNTVSKPTDQSVPKKKKKKRKKASVQRTEDTSLRSDNNVDDADKRQRKKKKAKMESKKDLTAEGLSLWQSKK
ncbi:Hypp612 [Branchiostoma lanceolatum]|uniref:Protein CUSTOS n=1 Tax=Branchiostoma lanceolatum TaxID=7740 RepID=A0A8J9VCE1_BRALA|nr:Hypp612 [Branchiostoma lanceolatum]